jgi:hypothetical protein
LFHSGGGTVTFCATLPASSFTARIATMRGGPLNHRFLPLSTIKRYEPQARKRKVSEVARGPSGFLPAYKRAGSAQALSDYWRHRREAFIARHMAQVEQRNEPLWDLDGRPSRRHLALVMWAYSPAASRL